MPSRRRDARHHRDRQAGGLQGIDFLATTAKHERVARLQADNGLTGAHAADHLRLDVALCPARAAFALADRDQLCVAACAGKDRGWNEIVVQNHVGFLQQLRRAQRQKIGIARACSHDVGDTDGRRSKAGLVQFTQHDTARAGAVARERQFAGGALDKPTPERAPLGGLRNQRVGLLAERPREIGNRAGALRQRRLDPSTQHRRQHGRCAARRDRDHHVATIDDCRQDEIAKRRTVGHVHKHAGSLGHGMGSPITLLRAGRDKRRDRICEGCRFGGGHLMHDGPGRTHGGSLAVGNRPLAHHHDLSARKIEEQRQVLHSTSARSATLRPSMATPCAKAISQSEAVG